MQRRSEGARGSVRWGRKRPREVERGGRNSMDARCGDERAENVDLDMGAQAGFMSNPTAKGGADDPSKID
jgi:hypothetical protein